MTVFVKARQENELWPIFPIEVDKDEVCIGWK